MGLNSKFYTVNFEKEIVVQGRNTTFLSIEAVQSEFSVGEKMVAALYVQPQTFVSKFEGWNYTPIAGIPTPPSGLIRYYFRDSDYAKNFDFSQTGFDSISIGDDVKAVSMWRRTLPGETALGNGPVDAIKFQSTVVAKGYVVVGTESLHYIDISDANLSVNGGETYLIQVGNWAEDNNWYINQGAAPDVAAAIQKRSAFVNYSNAEVESQFDGQYSTADAWPAGGDYRTRTVSGLPNPWSDYIYTVVSPLDSPRMTYRIDYDGDADSHLKISFLLVKCPTGVNPINFLVSEVAEFSKSTVNYGQKLAQGQLPPFTSEHRIDYQEVHLFGYRETPIRTNRTTYQNAYDSFGSEIYEDRTSFSVLKTNPKLTGNIKLTVDSGGALWLNSIDANQELSDSRFKKYAISSASTYQRDLYYFLDSGKFPKDTLFSLYEKDNQYLNTKRSFSEQYDNFYNYGVEQLNSRFYDEDFSFFAPLWLRKEMPDFFVIFRLDHPLNPLSYEDASNPEKFDEFFRNARIIKTFDMRESSPLGNYLRKITNDPRWNERPLQVSFDQDVQTTWFGADYTSGTITGKGEFLYDFWKTDNRILDFEETITGGFERNGLISTNLINLEFLFDDSEATLYTINRYFGLYVKENQLAEFELVPEILGAIPGQTPLPKEGRDGEPYSLQPFVQTNSSGVKLPVHYYHNPPVGSANTSATPEFAGLVKGKFPLPTMVDDPLRLFYVKDRNGIFKRVNKLEEVNYGTIGSPEFKRVTELQLFDSSENISDYGGITQITSQIKSDLLGSINSQLVVKISDILQSGSPLADYETIDIELRKLSTERRDYYYQLEITNIAGTIVTFDVLVPDYAGATPTVPTEYYATKVADFSAIESLNIDSYLQVSWSSIGIGTAIVGDTWDVKIFDGNIEYATASNTGAMQLTFYGESNYISYRWRLEANPIGLSPGESWDYPVLDPAGRDYTNTFSNKGTPEQVAQAIANCINSFENIIVSAKADGDAVYLRSKEKWEQGNQISLKRNLVVNKSVSKNLGFYENCNVLPNTYLADLLSGQSITVDFNNYTEIYTERYFYFNVVVVGPNTWSIEVRADVDPLAPTTTGTSSLWFVSGNASHSQTEFTISWDPLLPSFNSLYLMRWGRTSNEQYFVGGRRRSRSTARVPLIDGQRFYTDRKLAITGNTTSGSFTISGVAFPNAIYQGAPISGTGIPAGSRILSVDSILGTVTISKAATATSTGISISVGELSILNDTQIYQQWFQIQKENFSRLTGWEIQGKYIYALPFIDNTISGYENSSILQIAKDTSEFYYTNDARIVAYEVYRPSFGIFSVLPIKSFDVDTYFSDYSYAPTLELFRYYNREELNGTYAPTGASPLYGFVDGELLMNMGENYDLTLTYTAPTGGPTPTTIGIVFDVELYDNNDNTWKKADEIGTNLYANPASVLPPGASAEQINSLRSISLNTFYPLYFYDFMEVPNDYKVGSTAPGPYNAANPEVNPFPATLAEDQANDGPQYTAAGTRNFVRKALYTNASDEGRFTKAKISNIRFTTSANSPTEYPLNFDYKIRLQSSNYYLDENIKNFAGFQSLTDFLTDNDVQQIQQYTQEGSFDKFTYQMLLSEYDRLRENQQKDLAVKSKVVPSILKWVQEGTDARDNYYRLNNSTAFGITNFSPDSEVDFTEPLLLTHEFPYIAAVPKDYPEESLEGSRSYFFQKLSDVAHNGQTWYDLLTTDNTNDWFSKYFVVGYPNEISPENNLVKKSREERYTFFKYINGLDLSQTLFRGAKINIIDYDTTVVPKTPINESSRFDLYKFAAIARFVSHGNFEEEKPIQIEVINNEKYKTILIIITVFVQDYRLQAGLGDYSFFYYAIDQLRNSMQNQYPGGYGAYSQFFSNASFLTSLNAAVTSPDRKYPMELPYTALSTESSTYYRANTNPSAYSYSTANPWATISEDAPKALETMMPRQLFLGGGRLGLDDTKLGGKVWYVTRAGVTAPNIKVITQPLNSVDGTLPYPGVTSGLDYYPVFREVFPTIDNYRAGIDGYLKGEASLYVFAAPLPTGSVDPTNTMTVDGTLSELSVSSRRKVAGVPNPYTYFLYDSRDTVEDIRLDYLVFSSNSSYTIYNALSSGPTRATVGSSTTYSSIAPPSYPPYSLTNVAANLVPNISTYEVYQSHNLRGGSLYYKNKKNFISYANIAKLFNESSSYILYRKIDDNGSSIQTTSDFELRFVPFDKVKKLSKYYYKDDTDKPLEYQDVDFIGYDLVQTNEQEFEFRHRGMYEPKTLDTINFWAREDESFTKHFEKDFILSNTHINSGSSIAGLIRNYFYNKVSDFEVLEISRTSAYKSLYPLIGEIAIDRRNMNAIDSNWDSKYYRKYDTTTSYTDQPGTSEMQENKAFLAGKAMVVPKTFEFQTFNNTEVTFVIDEPKKSIGVTTLSQTASAQEDLLQTKPILRISMNLRQRLLRELLEGILASGNFDEFDWFNTLGISAITYTPAELEVLKVQYLEKNIIPLYEVSSIVLYANNREGLPILEIQLDEADKIAAGYREDQNVLTRAATEFSYVLEKTLDTKAANAYSVSAVLRRI